LLAQYFYDYTGKDAVTMTIFLVFIYLFSRLLINAPIGETRMVQSIIVIWIMCSYLVPYLRSIMISPMLNNRYTIVTLPAWIMVLATGWDNVKNLKWKYLLPLMLFISLLINMAFFKQHYTRIQKSQFREASEIVLAKNKFHYPVYSRLPWHFNFIFAAVQTKSWILVV